MDYQHYTVEDFILDEKFQDWVFHTTPALTYFWENFLQRHPDKVREIAEARSRLAAIQFHRHLPDEAMHQRIRARLQAHTKVTVSKRQIEKKSTLRHLSPYLAAACVALLLLVGVGIWQNNYSSSPLYQTAYAETQEVWLPDSTLVVLNAHSSITFPNYTTGPLREVWLEGEAFFEVTKNKQRPFIVHVDEMDVRVTGTSFNVADRHGKTQVVLESGQVLLETAVLAKPLTMKPGDLVAYDKVTQRIEQQVVIPEHYTAWRDHVHFFQETPLPEVAEVIETYYGQKVQLDPALSELKFTAKVAMQPEVDKLLTLLSETFDLTITKNQEEIMIQKE